MEADGEIKRLKENKRHYIVSHRPEDAEITAVQDRCLRVEHRRRLGGAS